MSADKALEKSALIVTTLTSFVGPLAISSVNVALPAIQEEFSADAVLLSWVATAYLLAMAVFLVPFGKTADIYGRKKIFTAGLIIYTLASFLVLFSISIKMLIAMRVLQGCGAAMFVTTGMAITSIGLFFLALIGTDTSRTVIILILAFLGFGFSLFSSPNMNAIMGSVEKRYFGIASGTVATMRLLGQKVSMAIAMVIFAVLIGREPISPANYDQFLQSVRLSFLIFACLCAVGILFSLLRGEIRSDG